MKIISVMNIKGGVGKSLTAELLARGFAEAGQKTLVVDADGQGDLTRTLLPEMEFDDDTSLSNRNLCAYLKGTSPLQDCIWHTSVENLDVLPSSLELFVVVYELNGKGGSDFMLYKGLHELTDYDVVIIDNNPSVNKMTFNSIYAADMIICPTNIGKKTLTGVANTRKICLQAMDAFPLEKPMDFRSLLTMMGRTRTTREGAEQLRTIYKDSVMKTEIRYQVKPVQECELDGKSLLQDKRSGVAEDYRQFLREIMNKEATV